MTRDEINNALDQIEILRATLNSIAKEQFSEAECPVGNFGHYGTSQLLWGLGCYEWTCEFCGTHFCT